MHPKITSRVLLAFALAAGLSFATEGEVRAQHSGHQGHEGHGTKKPAKKAPAKKRSQHGGHGAAAPAVAEYKGAPHKMMRDMSVPYTGDPDVDFRIQMIPHHQGAIDMTRVTLRHATDPWTRQLAEAGIIEHQGEIAEMQAWLARRGMAQSQGGQPLFIIRSSFPRHEEEAGTLDEARGQY